jgi:thiaminase (transcriptional activator TenA)
VAEHRRGGIVTGSFSDALRAASDDIWAGLHAHPFLGELSDGTLPPERFRFFLEQDDLFLLDYARCLALGAAKTRDEEELRAFTADLTQVLDAELPSNRALLSRITALGAPDRGGAAMMTPANLAYTSYLLSIASRGGPTDIMVALLPCAWSYVEIAQRLARRGGSPSAVYAEWIGYFTLPATEEAVDAMRAEVDRRILEDEVGTARRRELAEIFATSSRLERGFWEMAYTLEGWPDQRNG